MNILNLVKNTKLLTVLLITLLAVTGCSDADGMRNVQEYYKTDEVIMIPDKSGSFIARKEDGSIWYAYSSGFSKKI